MKTKTGFSLNELLGVIAIIAILAAILFPVFAKAIEGEKAKQAKCISNLKKLEQAFTQYKEDYNGYLPLAWVWSSQKYPDGSASLGWIEWHHSIWPYVNRLNVYECPSSIGSKYIGNASGWTGAYSYGINTAMFTYPAGATNDPLLGKQWSIAVKFPANTVILCDNKRYSYSTGEGDWQETPPCWDSPYIPQETHTGGINVAFADGHAKWYTMKNILWNWHTQGSARDQELIKMWRPDYQ